MNEEIELVAGVTDQGEPALPSSGRTNGSSRTGLSTARLAITETTLTIGEKRSNHCIHQ
jgi:hypothetical protein